MPTDLELMNIHIRALFTHDDDSRILLVNEPNGALFPAPRLFLGRTHEGNVRRFRADLPADICGELDALCADEPPLNDSFDAPPRYLEAFVRLLERHAPVREISGGPAYQFAEYETPSKNLAAVTKDNAARLLQGKFAELIADVSVEQPSVAFLKENRAVSICRSVRITSEAHEAGLETLAEFRGKDYAKHVTAEWARRVLTIGAIPLYSTEWKNKASQAVARKVGLKLYGTDFHIA